MKKSFLSACILLLSVNALFSQDKNDTVRTVESAMPELVVVSPYSNAAKSPLTISNISRKELAIKNYGQEPSAILAQTPSVTFYTDAGSTTGYSYFRIRGIDQTRINMSLNGVPLNEPEDQGVYFSNYPDFLESVSGIQIQRGAGDSKNGVAAYGGSLYFESTLYQDSAARQLSAGYGSFNINRVNGSLNTGLQKGFGLYARASHLHSDGYKEHSGNTSNSFFMNTGYNGEKHQLYILSFVGHQGNDLAWLGSPMDSIRKDPRYNADTKAEKDNFLQAHVQVHDNWKISAKNQLHTGMFYNYLKGNYNFDLNNFLGLPSTKELYNYAFQSNFAGIFSYHTYTAAHIKWYNGIQAQWYDRRHIGSEQTQGTLYNNTGYRNEQSLFTKAVVTFNKWNLLGDVQYRHSVFTYKGTETMPGQYWNFLNATSGISYSVRDYLQVYYSVGQTHREPARNDLFLGNDNLARDSTGALLFNAMKPEQVTDQELGIKYVFHTGYLYGNIYYMNFRNEITLNGQIGPTGLPLHSNAAGSFRSGIELNALYRLSSGIELRNQSSFSVNRIKENEIRLQPVLSPALISNQEIRMVRRNWQTGLTLRYQGDSYIDYANTVKLPAYFIINWDGDWQVGKVIFFTAVNNITNRKYFTNGLMTGSGVPGYFIQAPINFYTGIRLKW